MGLKKGSKLIRWNATEQDAVANCAADLAVNKHYDELAAFRIAQKQVLPGSRQKNLTSRGAISDRTRKLYRDYVYELNRELKARAQAASAGSLEDSQLEPVEPTLPSEPTQEAEPAPPPVTDDASPTALLLQAMDQLAELFATKLTEAVARSIRDAVTQTLQQSYSDSILKPVAQPVVDRLTKSRILVVGLLPAQADTVQRRYSNWFDLRFVSSQESPQLVTSKAGDSEKIVLMTNFINHSHQQAALQARARNDVVFVTGGVSSLAKTLDKLLDTSFHAAKT